MQGVLFQLFVLKLEARERQWTTDSKKVYMLTLQLTLSLCRMWAIRKKATLPSLVLLHREPEVEPYFTALASREFTFPFCQWEVRVLNLEGREGADMVSVPLVRASKPQGFCRFAGASENCLLQGCGGFLKSWNLLISSDSGGFLWLGLSQVFQGFYKHINPLIKIFFSWPKPFSSGTPVG